MFERFIGGARSGSAGLEKMRAEFGQMLDAGRHIFDTAANAFLGGTDLEVIRQNLFDTDLRINRAEQQIRREIVVHATVHGAAEFPPCLVLMSVVKDAERVGDYAKNIFDLAELAPHPPTGEHRDRLVKLKDRISQVMATCRSDPPVPGNRGPVR
jgi:phosphate uptake regulator